MGLSGLGRLQVEELEAVKGLKIGIKGHEAAARSDGKGRKIGIGPEAVHKAGSGSQLFHGCLEIRRFVEENNMRVGEILAIEIPDFLDRRPERENLGLGAEAQKAQH